MIKVNVNVFLLLVKGDEILLYFRENTGWADQTWSLVCGGQERGESAKQAMVREAYEEAGIVIQENDLTFTHLLHKRFKKVDIENVDIFMRCDRWEGEIENKEPHKCGELKFHPINSLPENIDSYLKNAIINSFKGIFYSEHGWDIDKKLTFS